MDVGRTARIGLGLTGAVTGSGAVAGSGLSNPGGGTDGTGILERSALLTAAGIAGIAAKGVLAGGPAARWGALAAAGGASLLGGAAGTLAAATAVGQAVGGGALALADMPLTLLSVPAPTDTTWRTFYQYQGSLLEPRNPNQQAGFAAVNRFLRGAADLLGADVDRREPSGPVLASTRINTRAAGTPTVLEFRATLDGGSWADADRSGAIVRVFVDGEHRADVVATGERDEPFAVNLGALDAGAHEVELRAAPEISAPEASTATVTGPLVARELRDEEALIARHAPRIEGRDMGLPGGRAEETYTDMPLAVVPAIATDAEGRIRKITYRTFYSGESGGTPPAKLLRDKARTGDTERAYIVEFDEAGEVVKETYEGPRHQFLPFQGTHVDEQPVLRVSTANNNYSQVARGSGTVWAPAPGAPTTRDSQVLTLETITAHPWMAKTMATEALREQQLGVRLDLREHLLLRTDGPVGEALRQGKSITLRLRDGRELAVSAPDPEGVPSQTLGLALPDGVRGEDLASRQPFAADAWTFDEDFTLRQVGRAEPA